MQRNDETGPPTQIRFRVKAEEFMAYQVLTESSNSSLDSGAGEAYLRILAGRETVERREDQQRLTQPETMPATAVLSGDRTASLNQANQDHNHRQY